MHHKIHYFIRQAIPSDPQGIKHLYAYYHDSIFHLMWCKIFLFLRERSFADLDTLLNDAEDPGVIG